MKKTVMIVLAMLMVVCIGGCGGGENKAMAAAVRVGGLKGPTSMGLLFMKETSEAGKTTSNYSFTMATSADELLPLIIKGEMDIALVPTNVAAVLYNKTNGGIKVIDVNTLGVLYVVSADASVKSIDDLKGKTVYMTGKGTVPEYSMNYILEKSGLADEVKLEFKSEPTEVAAILSEDNSAIGLLPQPFVTAACLQNEALKVSFALGEEYLRVLGDNKAQIVTGVTIVRNEFLNEHPETVAEFLNNHEKSAQAINDDVDKGAALAVKEGIVAKEPIAKKAIPGCSIVCIRGDEMKELVSDYLGILYDADASSVGGKLPGEDFYYINN